MGKSSSAQNSFIHSTDRKCKMCNGYMKYLTKVTLTCSFQVLCFSFILINFVSFSDMDSTGLSNVLLLAVHPGPYSCLETLVF